MTFVMLNPAKATAQDNDQTISKCIGFAERLDKDTLNVVNLYAYCTSYQQELYAQSDMVGPANQRWLSQTLRQSDLIVCAWGKLEDNQATNRLKRIVRRYQLDLFCLGINQDGSPKHPARLGYQRSLIPYTLEQ